MVMRDNKKSENSFISAYTITGSLHDDIKDITEFQTKRNFSTLAKWSGIKNLMRLKQFFKQFETQLF